nr:MAG TPA: hypothetical protein [Bacteriophage sp.]
MGNFVLYVLCYLIIYILLKRFIYSRKIISWLPIVRII